jgi:hypothetical protein
MNDKEAFEMIRKMAWEGVKALDHATASNVLVQVHNRARQLAESAQTLSLAPEWISVKDRQPLEPSADIVFEQQEYLVTDGLIVGVCDFQRGNGAGNPWAAWSMYGDLGEQRITHWMLKPAPPKQDQEL